MRHVFFLFCALAFQSIGMANANPSRNLAYDDNFVWYVSGRLAGDLVEAQKPLKTGVTLTEGEWAEQRMQYEILYHRYLIECDGPLPRVAEILRDFSFQTEEPTVSALKYIGVMNYEIWPVIQNWHGKIIFQLMDTYVSGRYGFFPECVVAGYRRQNPLPNEGSK